MAEPIDPGSLETLRRVGLTQYEARAYHALLRLGRADPAAIARASGVPPTRIHAVLKSLRTKAWAEAEGGRPILYVPAPPRERLAAAWAQVEATYQRAATDLAHAYEGRAVAASAPVFLRGAAAIAQKERETAAAARQHLALTLAFTLPADRELWPIVATAARRGRRVRVLVAPPLAPQLRERPWPALLQAGVEVRVFPVPARTTIADFERGLMIPRGERAAMWIPVAEIIEPLRAGFEAMWEQGETLPRPTKRAR